MRIIAIIILWLSYASLFAQTCMNRDEIDKQSFHFYMEKDYPSLKSLTACALANGIDFFYLRTRTGILAYEEKKYEEAIPHFEKALEFFPNDPITKEYLYFSYIFTNRVDFARQLAEKENDVFQKKVGYAKKPFVQIALTGGITLTDNIADNKGENHISTGFNAASGVLNGNVAFMGINLENRIKEKVHLYHQFSLFSTQSVNFGESNEKWLTEHNNSNLQYNIGMSHTTKKDWNISAGLGYFRTSNYLPYLNTENTSQVEFLEQKSVSNSFMGSFYVGKRFKGIQPGISLSFSNLAPDQQIQVEASLLYYPFKNNHFYGMTTGAFLKNGTQQQYVVSQKIGGKLLKKVWYQAEFMYGNLSNYQQSNTFLTYNTFDPILLLAGINFDIHAGKHFVFNPGYNFRQKESSSLQYSLEAPSGIIQTQTYFDHLIKMSLQWNF